MFKISTDQVPGDSHRVQYSQDDKSQSEFGERRKLYLRQVPTIAFDEVVLRLRMSTVRLPVKANLVGESDSYPKPEAAIVNRYVLRARLVPPLHENCGNDNVQGVMLSARIEHDLSALVAPFAEVDRAWSSRDFAPSNENS